MYLYFLVKDKENPSQKQPTETKTTRKSPRKKVKKSIFQSQMIIKQKNNTLLLITCD